MHANKGPSTKWYSSQEEAGAESLYSLRRSPLLWYNNFTKTLTAFGLKPIKGEPCLHYNDWLIVFFYVDDITAVCSRENLPGLKALKEKLMKKFKKGRIKIKWTPTLNMAVDGLTKALTRQKGRGVRSTIEPR